jgi:hypothetical protein
MSSFDRICHFYQKGSCRNGYSCKFLHEIRSSELPATTTTTATTSTATAESRCKYFDAGMELSNDDDIF